MTSRINLFYAFAGILFRQRRYDRASSRPRRSRRFVRWSAVAGRRDPDVEPTRRAMRMEHPWKALAPTREHAACHNPQSASCGQSYPIRWCSRRLSPPSRWCSRPRCPRPGERPPWSRGASCAGCSRVRCPSAAARPTHAAYMRVAPQVTKTAPTASAMPTSPARPDQRRHG